METIYGDYLWTSTTARGNSLRTKTFAIPAFLSHARSLESLALALYHKQALKYKFQKTLQFALKQKI
ncbi:MAG: hypothetical protein COB04_14715 [Gammaproteobacteria bacterium]|nr:MAG: hypothetical protein COB04_14715 [Gammaproteobacteria bacterium]